MTSLRLNYFLTPLLIAISACGGSECMDGYAVGEDGNCYPVDDTSTTTTTTDTNTTDTDTDTNTTDTDTGTDTTTVTTDTSEVDPDRECETFPAASGTISGEALSFNTFAWANVGNGVLVLGFKDYDKTACELVEDHVAGIDYWLDGAIIEMNLSGDLRSGATVEFSEPERRNANPPLPADVRGSASVSVIDNGPILWSEIATSGSASMDSFGTEAVLELTALSLGFADGSTLGSSVTGCYCADVELFWSTEIPDTDTTEDD